MWQAESNCGGRRDCPPLDDTVLATKDTVLAIKESVLGGGDHNAVRGILDIFQRLCLEKQTEKHAAAAEEEEEAAAAARGGGGLEEDAGAAAVHYDDAHLEGLLLRLQVG